MQKVQEIDSGISDPEWLIVRRLIAFLRGEPDADATRETSVSLLLATEETRDSTGFVEPLKIRRAWEGRVCFYLDPLALGITLINKNLAESLHTAWRACLPRAEELCQPQRKGPPPSIRLSPDLPGVYRLTGGSAGGLLACGIYAAMHDCDLDKDASASFTITTARGGSETLDAVGIRLKPVDKYSIWAKLKAAATATPPLRHVALSRQQEAVLPGTTKPLPWEEWTQERHDTSGTFSCTESRAWQRRCES